MHNLRTTGRGAMELLSAGDPTLTEMTGAIRNTATVVHAVFWFPAALPRVRSPYQASRLSCWMGFTQYPLHFLIASKAVEIVLSLMHLENTK